MCGIWALVGQLLGEDALAACLAQLAARGPDMTRTAVVGGSVQLGFTRLAINGLTPAGMQPFSWAPPDTAAAPLRVVANGEIYNYRALAAQYGVPLATGSDCEVLAPLYHAQDGDAVAWARALDGVFAVVLVDVARGLVVVARDPYGVRPLFTAELRDGSSSASGSTLFASEIKGLLPAAGGVGGAVLAGVAPFPPGHVATYDLATGARLSLTRYHAVPWVKNPAYEDADVARAHLRAAFEAAVQKRLLSDRPIGCLLSGGLDSSLVAALVARAMRAAPVPQTLQTFSIGMEGSTDLLFARRVAEHIGSQHHEVVVTEEQMLAAVPEVVAAIESYDITSVRASVGNYLVCKHIAAHTDIKVVFNGDGSDEVSGSYLYFYNAPGDHAFEREVERLLTDIHLFDVLRSDRSISCHGLEARTPFLDKQFVAAFLSMPTALRRPLRDGPAGPRMEKQLLREAFDDADDPLLPPDVLWRRKEAFSDGVSHPGKSWYSVIQEHVASVVYPGEAWKAALPAYGHPAPVAPYTRESLWYRTLWVARFGTPSGAAAGVVPYFWLPRWSGDARDPSARTLAVYAATPEVGTPLAGGASGATTPVLVATLKPAAAAPSLPSSPMLTATTHAGRAGSGTAAAAGSRSPLTAAAQAPAHALPPPPSPTVTATTTSRPASPSASPRPGGKHAGGAAAVLVATSGPGFDADGELPSSDGLASGGAGTTPLAFMPLV